MNGRGQRTVCQEWTREELDILCREWQNGGLRHVRPLLPGRSDNSIRGKKEALNLRIPGRSTYVKQELTEWVEAQIRREYTQPMPDVKGLAKRLNRTHGWVKYQARRMGVARRTYNVPWSPEEDQLLENSLNAGCAVTTIYKKLRAAGYRRTLCGIASRVEGMGLCWQRSYWSANDTAKALGIEIHSVTRWIANGQLKATQTAGPSCQTPTADVRKIWAIKPQHVREFMVNHPHLWDHRRMQKEVLLDLLLGGETGLNSHAFSGKVAA